MASLADILAMQGTAKLDSAGNHTVFPDGQIAYGGFSAPNAYQPQLVDMSGDGSYGYIDPATGRQVVPLGDESNPRGWAYYDMYGGPEGIGGAGEMVPGSDASNLMLPRSLAERLQADPNLMPELQRSGVGVVQQDRTKTGILQQLQSGELMPQLLMTAAGFGLPSFGLGNMISGATGLPTWAGSAIGAAAPSVVTGENPLTAALTGGALSAAWPYMNSLTPGGTPEFEANSFPTEGPVFTGNFNPNGGPLMPPASPNGDLGGYGTGPVFTGTFNPNGGPVMPPATSQGSVGYTPAQLAMLGGAAAAAGGVNSENSMDRGALSGVDLPAGTFENPPPESDFLNEIINGGSQSLSQILAKSVGGSPWMYDALGRAIPGLVGAFAANQQGDAISELGAKEDARVREFMAFGAPSRERYEASFQPGFDIAKMTGLQGAMDTAGDTLLRRLSVKSGNPYGDPGGLAEVQNYITGNVALPALQNYRTQNANTGGYSNFNTTAASGGNTGPLNLAGVNADAGVWNALGDRASNVFNPPSTLEQLLKQMKGNNIFSLA
jgi:hypothetical protein